MISLPLFCLVQLPPAQNAPRESNPAKNTRKRRELQRRSSASGGCGGDRDEETRRKQQLATSKSADPSTSATSQADSGGPSNDPAARQAHASNVGNARIDSPEDCNSKEEESARSHAAKPSSEEEQDRSRDGPGAEENVGKNCDVNISSRDKSGKTVGDGNARPTVSEKEAEPGEERVVAQETLTGDKAKPESRDQEDRAGKLRQQCASHVDKTKCVLKCKVDQVKRDLFSDEESDQRLSSGVASTQRDTIDRRTEEAERSSVPANEIPSVSRESQERVRAENNPKEELSSVLQCLQLVPTHKNEQTQNGKQQQQQQQPDEDKSGCADTSGEAADTEPEQGTANVHHYKAEYHFVYDDSAPMRKRRRRYSGHELQIEINYADLSDPNPVECIKVLRATEYEEIFNLPPKNSKKRTLGKKTQLKAEKAGETLGAKTVNEALREGNMTKPTTASSAKDESSGAKAKKPPTIKAAAASRTANDAQSDLKKKPKPEKTQEKGKSAETSRGRTNRSPSSDSNENANRRGR